MTTLQVVVENEAEQLAVEAVVSEIGIREGPCYAVIGYSQSLVRATAPHPMATLPWKQQQQSPDPQFVDVSEQAGNFLLSIADSLAFSLNAVVRANELLGKANSAQPPTVFDCPVGTVPSIPLSTFIRRFVFYADAGIDVLISSLVLIDRFILMTGTPMTFRNVYGLFTGAYVVSSKTTDHFYTSKYMAKTVAGIQPLLLNKFEVVFLQSIDSRVNISAEVFSHYADAVRMVSGCSISTKTSPVQLICALVRHLRSSQPS